MLLDKIASLLGGRIVKDRTDCGGVFADVELADGVRFHMHADGYGNEERITFSGDWPSYTKPDGTTTIVIPRDVWIDNRQLESPSISVSYTRPVEQIVKDVQRRFLPGYAPIWRAVKQRAEDQTAFYRRQRETAERVASRTGGKARAGFTEVDYGYEFGTAKLRGGYGAEPFEFEVTLREVSEADLLDIIDLLRARWRKRVKVAA
jgi:hypothetical protein